jgi:hypothetical protein
VDDVRPPDAAFRPTVTVQDSVNCAHVPHDRPTGCGNGRVAAAVMRAMFESVSGAVPADANLIDGPTLFFKREAYTVTAFAFVSYWNPNRDRAGQTA